MLIHLGYIVNTCSQLASYLVSPQACVVTDIAKCLASSYIAMVLAIYVCH